MQMKSCSGDHYSKSLSGDHYSKSCSGAHYKLGLSLWLILGDLFWRLGGGGGVLLFQVLVGSLRYIGF